MAALFRALRAFQPFQVVCLGQLRPLLGAETVTNGCHTVILGHCVRSILVLGSQGHILDLNHTLARVDLFALFFLLKTIGCIFQVALELPSLV
ncbi:hypothetical protein EDB82DRAFT_491094 [Fusarium venenatum]|uniref:uncharacterized protein n=1 Tax=Fusarium venenatum TaxID=56646 RepID=UPI001D9D3579|nr:hypothetical protein EDB82DRAFT_491094 [Fusarium venenatum]